MAFINKLPGGGGSEGTAVQANVLAGKTFSNDADTGLVGMMVNKANSSTEATVLLDNANSRLGLKIPVAGYYDTTSHLVSPYTEVATTIGLTADKLAPNNTILGIEGTYTSDATAQASWILGGQTAYVKGAKVTGTMGNKASVTTEATPTLDATNSRVKTAIPKTAYYDTNSSLYTPYATMATTIGLTADKLAPNNTILGIAGTYTSDATATAAQILANQTAYVNGVKVTGTMVDKSAVSEYTAALTLDATNSTVRMAVPATGYYSTSNKLKATYATMATTIGLTAAKLAVGQTVLGVAGTYTSDGTASAAQILAGKIAYVNGVKLTGTMLDKASTVLAAVSSLDTTNSRLVMTVPTTGYYDTASKLYTAYGTVATLIGLTAAKIVTGNTVLGVAGTGGGKRYIKVVNAAPAGSMGADNDQQVIISLYNTTAQLIYGTASWDNYIPYFTWSGLGISWVPSIVKATVVFSATTSTNNSTYEVTVTPGSKTAFIKHISTTTSTGTTMYYGASNSSRLVYVQPYSSTNAIAPIANAYDLFPANGTKVVIPSGFTATTGNSGSYTVTLECWE